MFDGYMLLYITILLDITIFCFASLNFKKTYPLVNELVDPENHQFLMETNLPSPICQSM